MHAPRGHTQIKHRRGKEVILWWRTLSEIVGVLAHLRREDTVDKGQRMCCCAKALVAISRVRLSCVCVCLQRGGG